MDNAFSITMDMDWAPDEVVDYAISTVADYDIKMTLFMTNKISVDVSDHEICIHPHFTSLNFAKHFLESLRDFPGAKGMRSHSLFFSERFRPLYAKYGLEYASNVMMYRQKSIKPYYISPATLEIPLFWMDSFYIEMQNGRPSFSVDELDLRSAGLKVFDFHPVHIFLNTCTLDVYHDAKRYYKQPKKLIEYRNSTEYGTEDFLRSLLEFIKSNDVQCKTLLEISNDFKK